MRIQPTHFTCNPKTRYNGVTPQISKNNNTYPNYQARKVSFGEIHTYYVFRVFDCFDPLNATEEELKDMSLKCHEKSIEFAIDDRYRVGFLTSNTKEKRRVAKARLMPLVDKILKEKQSLIKTTNELSEKALLGESNISEQKINVKQKLILPIERAISNNNNAVALPNGLLVYGKANKTDKSNFVKWIKDEAQKIGVNTVELSFDKTNPEHSFNKIENELLVAKTNSSLTGMHTLVVVDKIDELLTDLNNDESMDYIDRFKNIVENAADNYHVTFITQTDMPIEDFDSASIGSQRFNLKLKLKSGITKEEQEKLKQAKDKLAYYEEQASHSTDYMGEVAETVDDSDYCSL